MSDSEDLKILAEDLLDFLEGLEASVVKLKVQIEKLFGPKTERFRPKETMIPCPFCASYGKQLLFANQYDFDMHLRKFHSYPNYRR